MARNIYIEKAEIIEKYVLYEKTGEGAKLEKAEFSNIESLIDYMLKGTDSYIESLRKRGKRVLINLDISDKEKSEGLEKALGKDFRVKAVNSK